MQALACLSLTLVLAACYQPRFGECVARCTAAADCAPGQVCGEDGWCASAEQAGRCFTTPGVDAPAVDARMTDARRPMDSGMPTDGGMPDGGMPDAPPPTCHPGCPGTCQAGVCVISCTGPYSCQSNVVCPPTGACRVICSGHDSCREEIRCGAGRCTVTCSGDDSCRRGTRCQSSCACDVSCTGDNACEKPAACPSATCRAGNGCTSQPSGCSSC